jgi:allophanate hydrolase subunit 1
MALQRSRAELAQLRSQIEVRATHNPLAAELADEERELLEAEHALLLSLDEGRARRALLAARLRAAEAQLRTDA